MLVRGGPTDGRAERREYSRKATARRIKLPGPA
jgi:hypothetical protein